MQKVLITGISGFAGSHLASCLLQKSPYEIHGTYLTESSLLNLSGFKEKLHLHLLDLMQEDKVNSLVASLAPDIIFHLAALASPGDSFNHPKETIINNIASQLNLLEAVRNNNLLSTKILIVSSADVYGAVKTASVPIDENVPFNPTNPYALSKVAQDYLGAQYFSNYKLSIIRVRPFNHIGTRQSPHFAISTFAKKIVEIEKGKAPAILKVGNLQAKRDFTDVQDVVEAYDLVIKKGKIGEVYNIGSGRSYKMQEIVEKMLSLAKVKIAIEIDPQLLRPVDTQELLCDNRKIVRATGWSPKIPLEQTLQEVLDYWRQIV